MASRRQPRNPGLKYQGGVRIALRILGVLCTLAGAGLLLLWLQNVSKLWEWAGDAGAEQPMVVSLGDFNALMNPEGLGPFGVLWMPVGGGMLLSAGAWMLRVGFLGFATRYLAGETAPVVKDAADYMTDGEGFFGVGRRQEDGERSIARYCTACGAPSSESARFCQACGERIG